MQDYQARLLALRSSRELRYSYRFGNFSVVYLRISFEAQRRSASTIKVDLLLHISLIFLPEKSSVLLASVYSSLLESCLAYLLKIAALECLSGSEKLTAKSILLSIAGSRSLLRFVAHIKSTFVPD
jgi:hypothetical protein